DLGGVIVLGGTVKRADDLSRGRALLVHLAQRHDAVEINVHLLTQDGRILLLGLHAAKEVGDAAQKNHLVIPVHYERDRLGFLLTVQSGGGEQVHPSSPHHGSAVVTLVERDFRSVQRHLLRVHGGPGLWAAVSVRMSPSGVCSNSNVCECKSSPRS